MAKRNANALTFVEKRTGRKSKTIVLNAAPEFQMPRQPLSRDNGMLWHSYVERGDGSVHLYLNVEKRLESLEARIVAAINSKVADPAMHITVEQFLAMPLIMQEREKNNIDINAVPLPTTFADKELAGTAYTLVYPAPIKTETGDTEYPRVPMLRHAGEELDVTKLDSITTAVETVRRHMAMTITARVGGDDKPEAVYTVNDHVPVTSILDSLGVLKLIPILHADPKDENKKRLSHYRVDDRVSRLTNAQGLAEAIRVIQRKNRAEATKPAAPPAPTSNVKAEATPTEAAAPSK